MKVWHSNRYCRYIPLALLGLGIVTNFITLTTVPPGLLGDAARCGIYTWDFLQDKLWPFYVYHQWAPNPVILYLQAPVFLIFGFTQAAVRGVTAMASALAVPLVFIVCRELFRDLGEAFSRRAGLMAALGLALSPFVVQFFHLGTEGALLPVAELCTVAFLMRGVRLGRRRDFVAAGFFLGISQYIYITARVFPIAIALGCLALLLTRPALWRRWWEFGLTVGAAALTALPQWVLFVQYPFTFGARMQQTAGQFIFNMPNAGALFGEKVFNQVLMLGVQWQTDLYNPFSGRPLLTPVLFVGLLLSLGVVARRRTGGAWFALLMTLAMLVPDLISYEGVIPSATRLSGTYAWIFVLAGVGCAALWEWLDQRPRRPDWAGALVPVVVLLCAGEAQWDFTTRVLSQVNAMEGLAWRNSLVEMAEADYIHLHQHEKLLVPTSEYVRAPLTFLLAQDFPERAGGYPLPLQSGEPVRVVQPVEPDRATTEGIPSGYIADEWVLLAEGRAYFLPPAPGAVNLEGEAEPITTTNGVLAAQAFRAKWEGGDLPYTPLEQNFDNGLQLVGYRVSEFKAGAPLEVTLYWKPLGEIPMDVEFFTQVLDPEGKYLVGIHAWPLHGAYRVRAWNPGEIVPVSYQLMLPAELRAGHYTLTTGVFHLIGRTRIPVTQGGDMATVAGFDWSD